MRLALFLAAIVWYLCARLISASAAIGLAVRFNLSDSEPLLQALMLLFLVLVGLALLRAMEGVEGPLHMVLGMPVRSTAREEWAMGAAIGWGLAVVAVLPMVLTRSLSVQLWTEPRAWSLALLSLLTLAVATLANTLALFGYPFQRLVEASGPVRATVLLVIGVAVYTVAVPVPYGTPEGTPILVAILAAMLLGLGWLRTHAIWLSWGLHFAAATAVAVLFGLPLAGDNSFGSVVDARPVGATWLTGGAYGPAGAAVTIVVLLAAAAVLVRVTDDYAWDYTRPPIVAAGYDVTVAPPPVHAEMERSEAAPGSLVQIQPLAPPAAEPPGEVSE
ncbi:MAG TPA: hypothetical protein VG714_02630 [Acidobacteriaceae bacterium]|nr:hypothetical protein [Acidobacteriaceae bacterium]